MTERTVDELVSGSPEDKISLHKAPELNACESMSRHQLLELVAAMAYRIVKLEKALTEAGAANTSSTPEAVSTHGVDEEAMIGRIGFNYAYIARYPDRAALWIEEVMQRGVQTIPREFRPVMARALEGARTVWLPAIAETSGRPDCDTIILWAQSILGGDTPELDDDAAGIVTYMDNDGEHTRNLDVLRALPAGHRWSEMAKEFAALLVRDMH